VNEDDVNIQHNKRTYEQIRRERQDGGREPDDRSNRGHEESRAGGDVRATGVNPIVERRDERRTQRAREADEHAQGVQSGIRPFDRQSVNSPEGPVNTGGQTNGLSDNVTKVGSSLRGVPTFKLKNPFKKTSSEPVKLFTQTEAELEQDKLSDVYFHGSGLLDDVLEIIVKDHEPVQIWQLERVEAEELAGLHLQRAQKSVESARSARKLLEIYDRLYMYLLIYPRARQTVDHVKEHKGFSFK
jgi:hypothetical protein